MQPNQTLTVKAASLARSSPLQWQEFLLSLDDYTSVHKENLVNSPLPDIAINQGRAQALTTLTKLLRDSVVNSEKMKKD